ncbi:MAG: GNAT family N-acetyltransferase [Nocardioides sp.]|nr:GNAT family N-acetyltransferase [Nocardioides sp.]
MMISVMWPNVDAIPPTARCRLEPLKTTHARVMVDVLADPGLHEFTGGSPPTLDQLQRRYDVQSVDHSADGQQWWCNWIVTVQGEGCPVGYVQATVAPFGGVLQADVAWVIRLADQGRGLATEAARGMIGWLERHGVVRYAAYIHPEHAASAQIASRLGMHRTAATPDGEIRWESAG